MKILLINTPRSPHNMILESAPEEAKKYIHKKLIGPPLGLLTVAEAVKDHDVVFFETKGEYDLFPETPPLKELVLDLLKKHQPDVVGTTVIASEFYYAIEIFKTAKLFNPQILTIAGGLHTSLSPNDFTDQSVDLILPGQSAYTFREVIEAKEKNIDFESIPGIIINKNGQLIKTKERDKDFNSAKEDFLFPNRKLIERWRESYKVGNSPDPSTYIFTSLGCPYKCTFCSIWCQYKGKYLQRDVESIIDELKQIDDIQLFDLPMQILLCMIK